MSNIGAIRAEIESIVHAALASGGAGHGGGTDSGDVTQLKRENTGLRNRVKALEEDFKVLSDRVTTLESGNVTATAVAASAKTKAYGTK